MNPLMARGANAYRQTEAQSASPLQLIVMLYDGALRALSQATTAHAAADLAGRGRAISQALAIIGECKGSLDMERGGKVAADLDSLYGYIMTRLLDVSLKRDASALDEAHRLMATLREGWVQLAASGGAPAGQI